MPGFQVSRRAAKVIIRQEFVGADKTEIHSLVGLNGHGMNLTTFSFIQSKNLKVLPCRRMVD